PEFTPDITDDLLVAASEGDEELLEILRALGLRSAICVPLIARGRALGALTLVREAPRRRYQRLDLTLAEELARRAALAVDNAQLYREAERRGDAARALEEISDGVLLLDRDGVVRYLNPAAERLLDLDGSAVGKPAAVLVAQWGQLEQATRRDGSGNPETVVPLTPRGEERWLAATVARFGDDAVYTLRDVTEERLLERTRNEFVATASHELRTPVTGIFGAVRTLRRTDVELTPEQREQFLQ